VLVIGGLVARAAAEREAERVEGLMRSTFSASEESAAHFAGAIFGPLHSWIGYLTLAGLTAVVVSAVMMWLHHRALLTTPTRESPREPHHRS
jgi:hypothetical protein